LEEEEEYEEIYGWDRTRWTIAGMRGERVETSEPRTLAGSYINKMTGEWRPYED